MQLLTNIPAWTRTWVFYFLSPSLSIAEKKKSIFFYFLIKNIINAYPFIHCYAFTQALGFQGILADLLRRHSLWLWRGNSTTSLKRKSSSQCTWRVVSTCYYSKVNTNQVNEVKIALVGSENEVVFRRKRNCWNWQMIMRCLMVWWRRDSCRTLLMGVQIIFAELSPNSFSLALCMIYHNQNSLHSG